MGRTQLHRDLPETTNGSDRFRLLSASVHVRRAARAMVSLFALQGKATSNQKITNMEVTAYSCKCYSTYFKHFLLKLIFPADCSSKTFQLRSQQMGQITKSRKFPV